MTKVAIAARTVDLGADHAVGHVATGGDPALEGDPEARPPGSGFELGSRIEERIGAASAPVDSGAMAGAGLVAAAEGRFGTLAAQDPVGLLGQALTPLRVAMILVMPVWELYSSKNIVLAFVVSPACVKNMPKPFTGRLMEKTLSPRKLFTINWLPLTE